MTEPIVDIRGLKKTFHVGFFRKKVEAVKDVGFSIQDGEIFGIVGPNGSGKTTTFKMLTGLVKPDAGEILVFGEPVKSISYRRRIGFLPENPYFYEHLKVKELLEFYGRLHGIRGHVIETRAESLIDQVGLRHATDRPLRQFSKGMRQRAGLAQALINDPDLVILDEPQSGLDPLGRRDVRDLIFSLKEAGKTVVFSSHILPDVEAVCDRVVIINRGRVIDTGRLDDLRRNKERVYEVIAKEVQHVPESLLRVDTRDGASIMTLNPGFDIDVALKALMDQGAKIQNVSSGRQDLESVLLADLEADNRGEQE